MIYLIHGPDRLLARQAARDIANQHDPEGANTSWLDGRDTSIDQVTAAIGTISFFGGARVVVVSDLLGRFRDSTATGAEDSSRRGGRGQPHPILTPLAAAVPDQHCLVLLEPAMLAPPAALKSAAPSAHVIAAEPPRGPGLISWIHDAATSAGSEIDRQAAQLLAATLYPQTWDRKPNNPRYDRPPDLTLLTQEVEKLAVMAHPAPISVDHVRTAVPGGPDQRVFRFLDAALAGDLKTATSELERLEAAGEEPAMLLAQILGQIELMAVVGSASGRDANSIAREIGSVAASRISAVSASARRLPKRDPSAVALGLRADHALKTGRTRRPEAALRDLLLDLSFGSAPRKTGRSA